MLDADVQWDIWNEPDCCGFWEPKRLQNQYLEMWKRGFQQIRAAIPNAVIVGPSASEQPAAHSAWFNAYLDFVKANNVIPDILSWHELNPQSDPVTSKSNLVAMLSARGINIENFQVNEYGSRAEQGPGRSAWYLARLERAGLDGARANWGMYGALYDTMGELVVNADSYKPLGSWWVYKRYADLQGSRVAVVGTETIDGIAATDSTTKKAILVLGSRGRTDTIFVKCTNLPPYLIRNEHVHIRVEQIPQLHATPVTGPNLVLGQNLAVSDDEIEIPIYWQNAEDAYALTLTPPE
jgi:hypothetical protein